MKYHSQGFFGNKKKKKKHTTSSPAASEQKVLYSSEPPTEFEVHLPAEIESAPPEYDAVTENEIETSVATPLHDVEPTPEVVRYNDYSRYYDSRKPRGRKVVPLLFVAGFVVLAMLLSIAAFLILPMLEATYTNPTPFNDDIMAISVEVNGDEVNDKNEEYYVDTAQGIANFCIENGLNTVIVKYSGTPKTEFIDRLSDNDPLTPYFEVFDESGISVFIDIDAGFYGENLPTIVDGVCQNYAFSGFVFSAGSDAELELVQNSLSALPPEAGARLIGSVESDSTQKLSNTSVLFAEPENFFSYAENTDGNLFIPYLDVSKEDISSLGYTLFTRAKDTYIPGFYFGDMGDVSLEDINYVLNASKAHSATLPEYAISTELNITYPAGNSVRQTSSTYFITGTSDPQQPLLMNGEEVTRFTDSGTFGVHVSLSQGNNSFVFTQGESTQEVDIERYTYSSSGSGGTASRDGTVDLDAGDVVMVDVPIASALESRHDDGSYNETFVTGAVFKVVDSQTTTRSGKTTYAYQLSSGDWVLAYNTERVYDYIEPSITALEVIAEEDGERVTFVGAGNAAVYDERIDDILNVTIFDSSVPNITAITAQSEHISDVVVTDNGNGSYTFMLLLSQENPVWGHTVEYTETGLSIFLQEAPPQSGTPGLPLDGFVVMLDSGHGADDIGAPGVAFGYGGPPEAELNLNLATIIKERLEQLGAEVLMTRTDDSPLTLQERLLLQRDNKPHFFISVHHNSIAITGDGNSAEGIECYYFEPFSEDFATALVENVGEYSGKKVRGAFDSYYYVTRTTGAKSVLFEYGFVLNPAEYESLYSEEYVYAAAYGTAEAIVETKEQFYK